MVMSMTGFGRAADSNQTLSWQFEVKSVNGRGLDVRLNLPGGCEALEAPIRALFKSEFSRGNMQASLSLKDIGEEASVQIDTRLLTAMARQARLLDRSSGAVGRTSGAELLSLKSVISSEKVSREIGPSDATGKAVLETVKEALKTLSQARKTEGEALQAALSRIVTDMTEIVTAARQTADVQPAQLMAKLKARVGELLEDTRISEDRLEQEVALLVSKADVTEEIDRLDAHFHEAQSLIGSGKPVGRKLDFLSQELLREANTMGSKSASLEMTRHSLGLKSLIDQFKEQAANVE